MLREKTKNMGMIYEAMFCRKPLLMQGNLCLDVWLGIQVYQYTVYRIPVWFMGYLRIMYDCLPKPSLGLFGCVEKLDLTYHQFMASEVSSKKMTFWTNQKLACKNIWHCLMPVIDQVMIRYRKLYTVSSKMRIKNRDQLPAQIAMKFTLDSSISGESYNLRL